MMHQPEPSQRLYTAEQTRTLDRSAINDYRVPGAVLMSRAATAAFGVLAQRWPACRSLQVLCGSGNNGGDGFLLADLAHKRGWSVTALQLSDPARIRGDALRAREQALANGVAVQAFTPGCLHGATGVVVDAMLGSGLAGEVRPEFAAAIDEVNAAALPVLAVDIPSGLCADTGCVLGTAVRADATVTFIGRKRGLYTLAGPDCCGDLTFADLQVPPECYEAVAEADTWALLSALEQLDLPPERPACAHKGFFGHVLVVGGDHGMGGAVMLAAEAALRCGSGLVSVATREAHVGALLARVPEAMAHAVGDAHALAPLLAAADVVVLGPGLGGSSWSEQLFLHTLQRSGPTVIDADGLNLLARMQDTVGVAPQQTVLTPHPGEAARLLQTTAQQVQRDRFATAQAIAERFAASCVLKGNGSLIFEPGAGGSLCSLGNPGMASGGMGDVLSGVVGALLAQGLDHGHAARLAVVLHAAAADRAAADGQRGLVASDLMVPLRQLLR